MPRKPKAENVYTQGGEEYKRLQFFEDFLQMAHVEHEKAASMCGLARPTICHWLRQQDTKLSYINTIMEGCGYQLNILFTRDNIEAVSEDIIKYDDISISKDGNISLKRLAFLSCALVRYNISKIQLAKLLGMCDMAIKTWFLQDDILISRLYQCAEVMDCSIKFQIKPREGVCLSAIKNSNRLVVTEMFSTKTDTVGQKSNI